MNTFKLKAPFKPAGDQPHAIEKLVAGIQSGYKDQVLLGVTGSGKTMTMASVIEKVQQPTLIISHNKTLAAQLAAEFQEFFPDNAVHYFVSYYDYYLPESYIPQTDTYIEKETSINEEIDRLRHASTQALLTRNDVIIVASVSCIYGLGAPEEYENISLKLSTDNNKRTSTPIGRKGVIKKLIEMQYERNDVDLHRGTFRVRGGTIDVFPSFSLDEVFRISFKDDAISDIQILNSLTLRPLLLAAGADHHTPLNKKKEITIFPATHYVAPSERHDEVLEQIQRDKEKEVATFTKQNKLLEAQRLEQRVSHDIEMIRQTGYCSGIENYSRYFDEREPGEPAYTLIDYFSQNFLMLIDESHMTVPQIRGMYAGDRSRKETLINYGFRLRSAFDNRPLEFSEFEAKMPQTIYVSATPGPYELEKLKAQSSKLKTSSKNKVQNPKQLLPGLVEQVIRPTGLLDPEVDVRPIEGQVDDVLNEVVKRIDKKQRVLITTLTKRMSEDLAEYLQDAGIKAYYLHSEINTLERLEILNNLRSGTYDVVVGINLLREGLDLPEVSLVAILDADKEGFLRSESALIQSMGRAARHEDGYAILYADKMTGSMKRAITEVKRRRKLQKTYNKKHEITPRSIQKEISSGILGRVRHETKDILKDTPKDAHTLSQLELDHIIKDLTSQMNLAAQNLEYETAAKLRDRINKLTQDAQEKLVQKKSGRDQFAKLKALKK